MILRLRAEPSSFTIKSFTLLSLLVIILTFTTCKKEDKDLQQKIKYFSELESNAFTLERKYGVQKAIFYLDSIQKKDRKAGNISQIIRLDFLAYYYLSHNELDSAKYYVDQIVPILNKTASSDEIPRQYARCYFLLNDIYFARKNYLEAYSWLYLGRQIAKKNLNICDMAQFNYRIGVILYSQENYRLANKTFKESLDQYEECDTNFRSFYRRQEILNNVAFTYYKFGEVDSSLIFYNKALDLLKLNESRFIPQKNYFKIARAVVYGNMGQAFNQKGQYEKAISLLKTSIQINDTTGNDINDAFLQKIHLARVFLNSKKLYAFDTLARDILRGIETEGRIKSKANFYALLSDYHLLKGDTTTAFNNLKKYYDLNSKILEKDKYLNQTNITEQLNYIENRDNYLELQKIDGLKSIYLTVSIVVITMILALVVLIYFYWKKSKKTVEILRELNDKINRQTQELKLKNLEKDKILRVVAHDLRNPIGGISSITRLLKLEDLNSDHLEMVNMIEGASDDSLLLISEILQFTEDGVDKTTFQKVDLNQVLMTSVALLKFKTDEKQQKIILHKLDEPIYVLANREKLSRVFSNLVLNASKFSELHKTITINIKIEKHQAIISVVDEGIGIPKEIQNDIFTPFAPTKRKGTSNEKSFGMGLSICKQIIDLHEGEISFESSLSGSVFFVKLPVIK